MKLKLQAIKLSQSLTLTFKNKKRGFSKTLVFTDTHLSYKEALEHLSNVVNTDLFYQSQKITEDDYNFFVELQDTSHLVKSWSNGALSISGTSVTYNGTVLTDQLADFLLEKFLRNPHATDEFETWTRFIGAVNKSSSNHVVERLFTFLSHNDLHVTDDGEHVLAWKVVRSDFKDKYSGTFDNSPGQILSVPHNKVEIDPNKACSKGLHVAAISYIGSCFGSTGDKLLICKVKISDILSIPYDYKDGSKVRTCGYEVLACAGTWGVDVDTTKYPDLSKYGAVSAKLSD